VLRQQLPKLTHLDQTGIWVACIIFLSQRAQTHKLLIANLQMKKVEGSG
jgi:hypothetical protein